MLDLIGYATVPDDVEVAKTRLDQALGFFLSIPWWALLGFALISTLWLMWVSWPNTSINSTKPDSPVAPDLKIPPKAEIVRNKHFMNREVVLDAALYKGCTFQNCTLIYNGHEVVGLEHCTFNGFSFKSKSPEITRAIYLLSQLGLLKIPFIDQDGKVRTSSTEFITKD